MATTGKIKRSEVKSFLNTGTPSVPVWSLIAEGVPAATIAYNPKVLTENYIDQDSATTSIESYGPGLPIEMTAIGGNAVWEYVDALRVSRAVLDGAETELVNVWLYETPAGGYYYAEKVTVFLQTEEFGGAGGETAKIKYTLSFLGDPVYGVFDPAGPTFEALPVTTILTTMVIGTAVLTPLFATDKTNLLYTASVANAVTSETLTSTLAGATIVQKVGASTVSQGGSAALAVGLNHITIKVTVGSEINTYRIDITRAGP